MLMGMIGDTKPAGAVLWVPSNLTLTPLTIIRADSGVTWSGSNLATVTSTGTEAGTWTINGTPTKGTASNSIDPILMDANGEYLSRTYGSSVSSGKVAFFWFGKLKTINVNGFWNYNIVAGLPTTARLNSYLAISGAASLAIGQFDTGGNAVAPKWQTTTTLAPDTTAFHFVYEQLGTTNKAYSDGTEKTRGGTSVTDAAGACPTYSTSFPWELGRTAATGENIEADTFLTGMCNDYFGTTDLQKLEAWAYWTYQGNTTGLDPTNPYTGAPPTFP